MLDLRVSRCVQEKDAECEDDDDQEGHEASRLKTNPGLILAASSCEWYYRSMPFDVFFDFYKNICQPDVVVVVNDVCFALDCWIWREEVRVFFTYSSQHDLEVPVVHRVYAKRYLLDL